WESDRSWTRGYTRADGPVRPDHVGHRGGADRVRPAPWPLPPEIGRRRPALAADALGRDGGPERDRRPRPDAGGDQFPPPGPWRGRADRGGAARPGGGGRARGAGAPRALSRRRGHPPDARGDQREAPPPRRARADRGGAAGRHRGQRVAPATWRGS